MKSKFSIVLLALALSLGACANGNKNTDEVVVETEVYTDNVESSTDDDTLNSSCIEDENVYQTDEAQNLSNASDGKVPEIKFDTTSHDFGTVKLGESKTFEFTFKNTGEGNLVILDSNVYCNCMKLTLPKEPVSPGHTGKIIMKFTGETTGEFMKNAQIFTNCSKPMIRLNIEGKVVE